MDLQSYFWKSDLDLAVWFPSVSSSCSKLQQGVVVVGVSFGFFVEIVQKQDHRIRLIKPLKGTKTLICLFSTSGGFHAWGSPLMCQGLQKSRRDCDR